MCYKQAATTKFLLMEKKSIANIHKSLAVYRVAITHSNTVA